MFLAEEGWMVERVAITVARGDGIGPEIMDAVLRVLDAAGAQVAIEEIDLGERVYARGFAAGMEPSAWESIRRTKVLLKAPITTPQGGGFKSLNVTIRKALSLYANVRPARSYHPFVATKHPGMDVVIVRENEEDTYGGIEHRQTEQVYQCLKLITRPGTERIVRYAFEYARRHERRKVTCFTKDNIMKQTDGLFHRVFDEIAPEYPALEAEHWIVDIGVAKLADRPEDFDVIVMPNLYGDIASDMAAQIAGSVGMAGGGNVGDEYAMFEAIHGSAPRRAGQDAANPSGLLHGAIQMLIHIGQPDVAERVHNAWLRTLEDGVHTYDIYDPEASRERVGTRAFADAMIARLGQQPEQLTPVSYAAAAARRPGPMPISPRGQVVKETVGVDVFVAWWGDGGPDELAAVLQKVQGSDFELSMITNRGTKVWPEGFPETFHVDHWRCRFLATQPPTTHAAIVGLLDRVAHAGLDFIKTEHLCTFDGEPGYSRGQGEG